MYIEIQFDVVVGITKLYNVVSIKGSIVMEHRKDLHNFIFHHCKPVVIQHIIDDFNNRCIPELNYGDYLTELGMNDVKYDIMVDTFNNRYFSFHMSGLYIKNNHPLFADIPIEKVIIKEERYSYSITKFERVYNNSDICNFQHIFFVHIFNKIKDELNKYTHNIIAKKENFYSYLDTKIDIEINNEDRTKYTEPLINYIIDDVQIKYLKFIDGEYGNNYVINMLLKYF